MPGKNPVAQCFAILCFGAALLIVLLEWRDPFSLKTVKTPASTPIVQTKSSPSSQAPEARSAVKRPAWLAWLMGQPTPVQDSPVKVVVHLSQRQVQLYRGKTLLQQYPVAIGQADWQTPIGTFKVHDMQANPAWQHPITGEVIPAGPDNPLGSRWIGFWQDDTVQIGFHGTNQETLIGQAVSHGCVRMLNQDIEALYGMVEPGAVVVIKP
jgi:L,D-transpeptidase ErfK/SrfK